MRKSLLLFVLLFAWLGTAAQPPRGLLAGDDLAFLRQLTRDVLEDSKIREGQTVSSDFGPNATGGTLIRPGGADCYPAFWIRDYALSLDCGLVAEADQRHMLLLTAATQCTQSWITRGGSLIPFGAIADHIRIDDAQPIYFPGTYDFGEQGTPAWGRTPPYGDQFFFIDMAWHYVRLKGRADVLTDPVEGFRLIDRLEWAFRVPPARPDNHIVYTDEHFRGVDFGFRDAQTITGELCIASIFKYRAAREMADLYRTLGENARAGGYTAIADTLKAAIAATFADARGILRASTGLSAQADVWSTALAVYYGVLEGEALQKACTALSDAYRAGTLAHKGNIRHILTTDDYDEQSAWQRAMTPKNTYQNGAYWGTPTGWVCRAIARVDPAAARKLAAEYVADLRANDYRRGGDHGSPYECFHPNGHRQNPVYLTTVTCPLAAFEQAPIPR